MHKPLIAFASATLLSLPLTALANTATVASFGGDYIDVATAMADSGTWCGTPSASNPCMLKLSAGRHVVPDGNFTLPDYMSIKGDGMHATVIYAIASDRVLVTGSYSDVSNLGIDLGSNKRLFKIGLTMAGGNTNIHDVRVSTDGLVSSHQVKAFTSGNGTDNLLRDVEVDMNITGGYVWGIDMGSKNINVSNATVRINGGTFVHGIRSTGVNTVRGAEIRLENATGTAQGFIAKSSLGINGYGDATFSDIRSQVYSASSATKTYAVVSTSGRSGNVQMRGIYGRAIGGGDEVGFLSDGIYNRLHISDSQFIGNENSIRVTDASSASGNYLTQINRVTGYFGPINISTPNAKCSAITDAAGVFHANTCPN